MAYNKRQDKEMQYRESDFKWYKALELLKYFSDAYDRKSRVDLGCCKKEVERFLASLSSNKTQNNV